MAFVWCGSAGASPCRRGASATWKGEAFAGPLLKTDWCCGGVWGPQTSLALLNDLAFRQQLNRAVAQAPDSLLKHVIAWGRRNGVLEAGSRVILVGHAAWLGETHDLMMVHVVP